MPGRVSTQKRALADNANSQNVVKSPQSAKKRKLNDSIPNGSFHSSQGMSNSFKNKMVGSQPKSQFETEVLEKMTQDISGLKNHNAEKDQQWDRPALKDFNEKTDSVRFQCIDIEEGTLHGGKVTLKMFGVSEVREFATTSSSNTDIFADGTFYSFARYRFPSLPLCCCSYKLSETGCGRLQGLP